MKRISFYVLSLLAVFAIAACSQEDESDITSKNEDEVPGKQFKEQSIESQPGTADYQTLMESFVSSRSRSSVGSDIYPDYYGGSYIDENGELVVYITKGSVGARANVQADLNGKNVIIKSCDYSYNLLNEIMDKLNKYQLENSQNPIAENFTVYLLDDSKNRIIVKLTKCDAAAIKEFKANVMDSPAIEFVKLEKPFQDAGLTLYAGSKYNVGNTLYYGSFGYRAMRWGRPGFVSSGHVMLNNGVYATANNGSTILGTCMATQVGGNVDACFIEMSWDMTASDLINRIGGKLSPSIYNPSLGTIVNTMGVVTLGASGVISSINASVRDVDTGIIVTDCLGINCTSAKGDSGGIVYIYKSSTKERIPVGIIKGIINNETFCVKANNINNAFGLTMY